MSNRLAGFDSCVESAMKDWRVPGLGLAVVEGDRAIHVKAYGLRDPEKNLPMTTDTRYRLASNTKAFTSMAVGILVDEGKVSWDTPVRRYIPELRLADPWAMEHITPRDLLCHRTGLPAHDAAGWSGKTDRPGLVARLAYLEPSFDPRTKLQYNNLMFMLAGHLVERVSGVPYEQFVTERILEPLGMEHSTYSHARAFQTGDFAECYWQKDGRLMLYRHDHMPGPDEVNPMSPGGGLVSTANDMVPWLVTQLNGGVCAGKRVVSEQSLAEMHTPQMIDNWPCPFPELGHSSAGLGWFIWTYRGFRLVLHGGFFGSQLVMLPAKRIGIAFMPTLGMHSALWEDVCFTVFDRLLELPALPWHERLLEDMAKQVAKEKEDKAKARIQRRSGTNPSRALQDFCGRYEHPGYGSFKISADGVELRISAGDDETFPLRHFHFDTFEIQFPDEDDGPKITFCTDAKGCVASISAPFEPAVRDIVFTRSAS
jgi:CubicO group peptidase (beta-lactamase class C family)